MNFHIDLGNCLAGGFTLGDAHSVSLHIADELSQTIPEEDTYFREIQAIVESIKFQADQGQSYYNQRLEESFVSEGARSGQTGSESRGVPQSP